MKTADINIRDPFVLVHNEKYYMYGTRSATAWSIADGFDCYISDDLEEWEGPIEIFHNDGTFWADRHYWAPECFYYKGAFYLFATFKSETKTMGVQILRSPSPTGPFEVHSDGPVTPKGWECLDGTLYIDKENQANMVFSRSFLQNPKGEMYVMTLSSDLSEGIGEPLLLFTADEAPWSIPFPYGEAEFGVEDDMYFSDGPFLKCLKSGRLIMIWSTFGNEGYSIGVASAISGDIQGPWIHEDKPLFGKNGGHGMFFESLDNRLLLTLHSPNEKECERPIFIELKEMADQLCR